VGGNHLQLRSITVHPCKYPGMELLSYIISICLISQGSTNCLSECLLFYISVHNETSSCSISSPILDVAPEHLPLGPQNGGRGEVYLILGNQVFMV
jgi:hypothetical protein